MVTREQAKLIKEYLDLWQMYFMASGRLSNLGKVNLAVRAGSPNYPKFMQEIGMEAGFDRQSTKGIIEREMEIVKERRLLYFEEIYGIYAQLNEMDLVDGAKKHLDSLQNKVVRNQKINLMTETALGISEATSLMNIIRDQL